MDRYNPIYRKLMELRAWNKIQAQAIRERGIKLTPSQILKIGLVVSPLRYSSSSTSELVGLVKSYINILEL